MKKESIGERVQLIIEGSEKSRANTNALLANYWFKEFPDGALDNMTAKEFLARMANGQLPLASTILRVARTYHNFKEVMDAKV